jgi:hypothetical protein
MKYFEVQVNPGGVNLKLTSIFAVLALNGSIR